MYVRPAFNNNTVSKLLAHRHTSGLLINCLCLPPRPTPCLSGAVREKAELSRLFSIAQHRMIYVSMILAELENLSAPRAKMATGKGSGLHETGDSDATALQYGFEQLPPPFSDGAAIPSAPPMLAPEAMAVMERDHDRMFGICPWSASANVHVGFFPVALVMSV